MAKAHSKKMWFAVSNGALHMGHPASAAVRMFLRRSEERDGIRDRDSSQAKNRTRGGAWFSYTKL
jgi:hypothetical protein